MKRKIIVCIICGVFVSFMSVGYASLSDELEIYGFLGADTQERVFIVDAETVSGSASVNSFTSSALNSTVDLKNENVARIEVTVFNNASETYGFNAVKFIEGMETYDNQEIKYTLIDLERKQEIVFNNKNETEKEEEKDIFGTRHNYSFEAKMALSDFQIRHHHKEILDFAHSYGLKVSRSWKQERIYLGKKTFASLSFKGKKLCVALALDPKEYENSKYKFIDVSNVKRYQNTPLLFKITSERKVKHSLELLKVLLEKEGVQNQNLQITNKKVSSKNKKKLIEKGLIKVAEKDKQTI